MLLLPSKAASNQNHIVAKIHEEFDTNTERAIIEAKRIISNEKKTKRGERLRNMGFTKTKEAELSKMSAEVIKLSEHYKQAYPHHKFIVKSVVSEICNKYGLILGNAAKYIGTVPEKNLLEMESFTLKKEDITETDWMSMYLRKYMFFTIGDHNADDLSENTPSQNSNKFKPEFEICAPQNNFDTAGMEIIDNELVVKDPVVLHPVKGGYLIVTKWGLEGEDESLVNEKHN